MWILRSGWQAGPAPIDGGPVLVSVTDFTADRAADLPGIAQSGFRLRSGWSELEGAIGMWLWAGPLRRRVGSVSLWTGESALRGFVAWRPHVEIMRHYRRRGAIRATTWTAESADLAEAWRGARRFLASAEQTRIAS